jgi:hypothetical protein
MRRLGTAAAALLPLWLATVGGIQKPQSPSNVTTRVSVDSAGGEADLDSWTAAISADGRFVAFSSDADNLVANDTNQKPDVFVRDRVTGATVRVSVDSNGNEADRASNSVAISADGGCVAFTSHATNLVPGDANNANDVFVRDLVAGTTERVSVDSNGNEGDADSPGDVALSADGRFVAFQSNADNLVAIDGNHASDVFVHDRATGLTERVSVDSAGGEADSNSVTASISGDGSLVAFGSDASNLVASDTNQLHDVFLHDRASGVTERVSVDPAGQQLKYESRAPVLSSDGRIVAWYGGGGANVNDVFARDRAAQTTECMSVDSAGVAANGSSYLPVVSGDGRFVVFHSFASNLVAGDTNRWYDVFAHDRSNGTTLRVSLSSADAEADNGSVAGGVSADGSRIAFLSYASNLVAGDTNGMNDVFVREICVVDASWANYGAGWPGTFGVPSLTAQSDPVLGSTLKVDLENSSGLFSVTLFLVGYQQASLHSSLGGDLLLIPSTATLLLLPPGGTTLVTILPGDLSFAGFEIDSQALETDLGATKGVSFTAGLQLILGG